MSTKPGVGSASTSKAPSDAHTPSAEEKRAFIRNKFNPSATELQRQQMAALLKNPDRASSTIETQLHAPQKRTLSPPPELVSNVAGSSAGAGSGEFHVYKQARRKEFERMQMFEEEEEKERSEKEFERAKSEREKRDEAKTEKNRLKRLKRRGNNNKAKGGGGGAKNRGGKQDVPTTGTSQADGTTEDKPKDNGDGEGAPPAVAIAEPKGLEFVEDAF